MTQPSRPTDGALLAEFLAGHGQAAFTELVNRHGAMVHGVALRVLADHHEAQDVTQAVFLTLARKASALRQAESVGGWLHTVARRMAVDVQRSRHSRQRREMTVMREHPTTVTDHPEPSLFRAELDTALSQLPQRYSQPVVLFHLEAKSLEETARTLGLNLKTASTRLVRARELLRQKLVRRGVTVGSVGALTALLSAESGAAVLPSTIVAATVKAATGGAVSTTVAALTQGALHAMFIAKVKAVSLAAAAGLVLAGSGVVAAKQLAVSTTSSPPPVLVVPSDGVTAAGQSPRTTSAGPATNFTAVTAAMRSAVETMPPAIPAGWRLQVIAPSLSVFRSFEEVPGGLSICEIPPPPPTDGRKEAPPTIKCQSVKEWFEGLGVDLKGKMIVYVAQSKPQGTVRIRTVHLADGVLVVDYVDEPMDPATVNNAYVPPGSAALIVCPRFDLPAVFSENNQAVCRPISIPLQKVTDRVAVSVTYSYPETKVGGRIKTSLAWDLVGQQSRAGVKNGVGYHSQEVIWKVPLGLAPNLKAPPPEHVVVGPMYGVCRLKTADGQGQWEVDVRSGTLIGAPATGPTE
jgi:RNA polymerase sigma factor (sigma-70 family)